MPGRVVKMLRNTSGNTIKGYSLWSCSVYGGSDVVNNNWGHVDSYDGTTYGFDDPNKMHSQKFSMMNPYHTCYIWRRTA